MKYVFYICPEPEPDLVAERCPVDPAHEHTPQPKGYLNWHEWAEQMSKTHRQIECPGCGLLKVWVKFEAAEADT